MDIEAKYEKCGKYVDNAKIWKNLDFKDHSKNSETSQKYVLILLRL